MPARSRERTHRLVMSDSQSSRNNEAMTPQVNLRKSRNNEAMTLRLTSGEEEETRRRHLRLTSEEEKRRGEDTSV